MRFSNFLISIFLLALGASFANGSNLVSAQVAPGTLISFAGANCPVGYLAADGTSLPRTGGTACGKANCAALFAAIGTAWGAADGTHFNVPDMRGQFARFVTGGSANDPGAASRTAINTGGNAGNNVGSAQGDQFKNHVHQEQFAASATGSGGQYLSGVSLANGVTIDQAPFTNTTGVTGGNETRPINAYVTGCVKY